PNGKINRKALPAPDSGAYVQEQYVAPRTETERVLVEIWSSLLRLPAEMISVTANFFTLGGHSLLATRLVNLIEQRLGIELPLRSIFESPSIRELVEILGQHAGIRTLPLLPVARTQALPLSYAQ